MIASTGDIHALGIKAISPETSLPKLLPSE